jgi:hypothetical protein
MERRGDGTYFLVDEQKWTASSYSSAAGTWGSVGVPARYVPGNPYLGYPKAVGANDGKTTVSIRSGGSVLQVFASDAAYTVGLDIGSAGYGHVSDIEIFPDGSFSVWDNDNRRIGYFEVGSIDVSYSPFDFDTVRHVDLEISGGRTYAAVTFEGYSEIGYFTGTEYSGETFTSIWNSAEDGYFTGTELNSNMPYLIEHLAPAGDAVWAVFPHIGSAVKIRLSGEIIGSFCLIESFGGERVLPGRFYNYAGAAEDGSGGLSVRPWPSSRFLKRMQPATTIALRMMMTNRTTVSVSKLKSIIMFSMVLPFLGHKRILLSFPHFSCFSKNQSYR